MIVIAQPEDSVDALPFLCQGCKQELYIWPYSDKEEATYLLCPQCSYHSSFMQCDQCGHAGPLIDNIQKNPTFWNCPECNARHKVPADFYDQSQTLITFQDLPPGIIPGSGLHSDYFHLNKKKVPKRRIKTEEQQDFSLQIDNDRLSLLRKKMPASFRKNLVTIVVLSMAYLYVDLHLLDPSLRLWMLAAGFIYLVLSLVSAFRRANYTTHILIDRQLGEINRNGKFLCALDHVESLSGCTTTSRTNPDDDGNMSGFINLNLKDGTEKNLGYFSNKSVNKLEKILSDFTGLPIA